MTVRYRLEAYVEIKASAHKFYEVFRSRPHHVPNISPSRIPSVDVHQGDWQTHGSVKVWKYSLDGKKVLTYKERVEFDDESKTVTLVGLEGDVFEDFKNYITVFQAIPKDDSLSVVKGVIEYEKLKEDGPDGIKNLDFVVGLIKDIEAHLVQA
ncbi:hypothetical protein SLA2020_499470 [Shorea laevis]